MAAASTIDIDNAVYLEQLKPKIPAHIEFGRKLGKGGFGQVHLVEGVDGVAVKLIKRDPDQKFEEQIEDAEKEYKVLKKLNSEHFVRVYDLRVITEPERRLLILMEYMPGGTLNQFIKDSPNGRLDEFDVKVFARQLLHAIQHMHRKNVMNRDLKPENILLDATKRHLKICDFGLAAELCSERTHTALGSKCGTSRYIAPEIDRGEYGTKSELWSLGIILVEMNTGESIVTNLDELLHGVSKEMKDLISRLLVRDPLGRPTASEALEHALFMRTKYISRPYTGERLSCSNSDFDGIIAKALDNKLPIYALDPLEKFLDGNYHNTGIFYIPDLGTIIIVNDQYLAQFIFPVAIFASEKTNIVKQFLSLLSPFSPCLIEKDWLVHTHNAMTVSINAIETFVRVFAKREDPRELTKVYIIADGNVLHNNDLISTWMVSPPMSKVRIEHLDLQLLNDVHSSTLSAFVKYMAANVEVSFTLSLSCSPCQPIANLCEAITDMDGGLLELRLNSIDLSGEQRLADTLKCMEMLKFLTLNNTGISADALVQIGHKLKHKLGWLNIFKEPCLQSPDTCGRFFNAIKQSSEIWKLYLTDNKLNGSHLSALPAILPTMKELDGYSLYLDGFEGSNEFMQQLTQTVGSEIASKVHIGR